MADHEGDEAYLEENKSDLDGNDADLEEREIDLEESEVNGLCINGELETYNVVTDQPFSYSDTFIIENIVPLSSTDMVEGGLHDAHQLIVDKISDSGGHVMTSSGHLVTSEGLMFRLYKDVNEPDVTTSSGNTNEHRKFIFRGLPYSPELLRVMKAEVDDVSTQERPSKRLCIESERDNAYDIVLSVANPVTPGRFLTDLKTESIGEPEQILDEEDSNQSETSKSESSFNNLNEVSQSWFTTKDDKLSLQNKGHRWKQGQWTKLEVDTLQKNIGQYCEERGIKSPAEVIFDMTKDERKNFYRTIARDLQRPLFSVYRRVIRMYDRKNYIGKYTQEELTKLKELRKKHGSDWATIGSLLGRSASSVKDRCRLMKDTCNTGKWYPEEEKRLAEVVYRLSGASPGESVTGGLSWAQVAEHVTSRSEKQCRTKWLNYLNWKEKGGAEWTRDDDLLLLERLSEVEAEEEGDINWVNLAADWPSARSPQWLHGKWWSMKRHVSNYSQLQFPVLLQTVKSLHVQNKARCPPTSTFSSSASGVVSCSDGIKLEQLDYQNIQMMQGVTLTIPVTMSIDSSLSAEVEEGEGGLQVENGVQSYHLLDDVCDHHPEQLEEAYVITNSDTTDSPTFFTTTNGIISENFVVHTLESIGRQVNKNVVVQMTPAIQQIIITRDLHDDSNDSPLILSNNHPVFHQLDDITSTVDHDAEGIVGHRILNSSEIEQEEEINSMAVVINHGDLDVGSYVSESNGCDHMVTEILTSGEFPEVIIESEIQESIEGSPSLGTDLVSFSSSHFVPLEAGDGGHPMSSFSDPMLITDGADLLGSISHRRKSRDEAIDSIDQSPVSKL